MYTCYVLQVACSSEICCYVYLERNKKAQDKKFMKQCVFSTCNECSIVLGIYFLLFFNFINMNTENFLYLFCSVFFFEKLLQRKNVEVPIHMNVVFFIIVLLCFVNIYFFCTDGDAVCITLLKKPPPNMYHT